MSTEDTVIYLLGNPQCDVGDWLTLINKLDTIATYSISTDTCQQQQSTPSVPMRMRMQARSAAIQNKKIKNKK